VGSVFLGYPLIRHCHIINSTVVWLGDSIMKHFFIINPTTLPLYDHTFLHNDLRLYCSMIKCFLVRFSRVLEDDIEVLQNI